MLKLYLTVLETFAEICRENNTVDSSDHISETDANIGLRDIFIKSLHSQLLAVRKMHEGF